MAKKIQKASDEYRTLRNQLLNAELELKDQREHVAALRRQLPMGARVESDYIFQEGSSDLSNNAPTSFFDTRLSELFADDSDQLIVIHYMYDPDHEKPCPMCTMWADGHNAIAAHISNKVNFVLVAKAQIEKLRTWAHSRAWNNIRLLSSFNNSFNQDFQVEEENGGQKPGVSVFSRLQPAPLHLRRAR